MSQQFFKGRTNNHLTWAMVDATDFATPESALSAAMKIKIWGKLAGATGVNFVSSGTGSLTNDIVHVGPSVLGLYTIALAKADLSDASAAWYDQYIVSLSATGAAYQVLVVEGGIYHSYVSNLLSNLSNYASNLSGLMSDTYSAAILGASHASDAYSAALLAQSYASDALSAANVGNSRILLVQSRLSDFDSRLVSDVSDIRSMLTALSDAISDAHSDLGSKIGALTVTLTASDVSDIASAVIAGLAATGVQLNASSLSDIRSAIAAGPAATVTASDISDIASAVWANAIGARVDSRILVAQSYISDAFSAANQGNSRILLVQSRLSDLDSRLVSDVSDIRSMLTALSDAISDAQSDLSSKILLIPTALTLSDISDIASAVWANSIGTRVDSRILLNQSRISDTYSLLSDTFSTMNSQFAVVSNYLSYLSAVDSDALSALVALSDAMSDLKSVVTTTGVQLNASSLSDLRSAITAVTATVSASNISDIASAVQAILASDFSDIHSHINALSTTVSNIGSAVWADTAGAALSSRVLLMQSRLSDFDSRMVSDVSDIRSMLTALSDNISDFRSFVTTTGVQINASSLSDIRSAIAAGPAATVTASDISDIASAVWANAIGTRVDSRVLLNQSRISDIASYLVVMSGMLSDTYSQVSDFRSDIHSYMSTTGVGLHASAFSDIRSAISAGPAATVTASDISDIASAVWANVIGARVDSRVLLTQSYASDAASAAAQGSSRTLLVQSRLSDLDSRLVSDVSDIRSMLTALSDAISDSQSDLRSFIGAGVALDASTMSDLRSAITAGGGVATISASDISDIASAVWANTIGARVDSRVLLNQSRISDTYSMLSDFYSDFTSKVPKRVATDSQLSDVSSDLRSLVGAGVQLNASSLSDIRSAITAGIFTLDASAISDIASAVKAGLASDFSDVLSALTVIDDFLDTEVAQINSRILVTQSMVSDTYSMAALAASAASDAHSAAVVARSYASDALSAATLLTTAHLEPTGVPGANATPLEKIGYIFAALRNKVTVTNNKMQFYDDAGIAMWEKDLSDDGITYAETEGNTI